MSNLAYMYKMLGQLDKAPVDGKGEEHGKIRLKAGKCCVSYLFIFFPAPVLEIISDNFQWFYRIIIGGSTSTRIGLGIIYMGTPRIWKKTHDFPLISIAFLWVFHWFPTKVIGFLWLLAVAVARRNLCTVACWQVTRLTWVHHITLLGSKPSPGNPRESAPKMWGFPKKQGRKHHKKHHKMMAIDGKMMIHRFMGKAYFQKPLGRPGGEFPCSRWSLGGPIPCLVTSDGRSVSPRFASFGVEAAMVGSNRFMRVSETFIWSINSISSNGNLKSVWNIDILYIHWLHINQYK